MNANDLPPDDGSYSAAQEALVAQLMTQLPPNLFDTMRPLLQLTVMANFMLVGYPNDPVPQALQELLGFDADTVQLIHAVQDTPSLARVMALHSLPLFDFLLVGRLVYESPLDEPLRTFQGRAIGGADALAGPRDFVLTFTESLLENLSRVLSGGKADLQEELHLRRLQTESIFARLGDTLRPYYPPGQSPADIQLAGLDQQDEAEDSREMAAFITLSDTQRRTLHTAALVPKLLMGLDETAFGHALMSLDRFRPRALQRLADRLLAAQTDEPFSLSWSELLRLYQASQVCALSAVAEVLRVGTLEDLLLQHSQHNAAESGIHFSPEQARTVRQTIIDVAVAFIGVVESEYPNNREVVAAKTQISQLAELLA